MTGTISRAILSSNEENDYHTGLLFEEVLLCNVEGERDEFREQGNQTNLLSDKSRV